MTSGNMPSARRKKGEDRTVEDAATPMPPSTRRKKKCAADLTVDRTVEDEPKTSVQKKEKKSGRKNKEGKDDQSTEFEPIHVASRPAVSKNLRRSLKFPDQKDDKQKEQPPSGSASNETGSSNSSAPERLRDKLKKKAAALGEKTEDDPTIFQKVKAAERPAITRMKSHRSGRAKEKEKKRAEQQLQQQQQLQKPSSSDRDKPAPVKESPRAVAAAMEKEVAADEAPTTFEKINAPLSPAIVIEKPRRRLSRRSTKEQRKPATREEEKPVKEEIVKDRIVVGPPSAETTECSTNEKAKMCTVTEDPVPDQSVDEQDVPENPAYTFEIWKVVSKPKCIEKPKEEKKRDPKPDEDELPKSDYIMRY